ncbi:AMP-binding protein [Streptomyces sp. NBC_00199]|uniref:AMP-binding protein n=1 Tax=Streptomyces sp. NBC_00199 TaxID=2975678 RepID=UPI00225253C5|nr:AMP-binding protein [Streptomyces sp. NBC_00199]MCX5265548.1 AMP-binding protein [Streptomyces sp. NBC_00199]
MITDPALATRRAHAVRPPHAASALAAARPASPGARTGAAARTLSPSASPSTLDALFAQVAQRHPDAVAVQDARGELRFAAAESWAARLASVLVHRGVQLGDPVIIHCDDHRQALTAQLAVLKAGGVCVPAPHGLGRSELRGIAAVSGASTVLCSRSTQEAWPRRYTTLSLDDDDTRRRITAQRLEPALPLSHSREAAYLLVHDGGRQGPAGHLVDHHAWRLAVAERIRTAGPAPRRVFVAGPPAGPRALSAMWWAFSGGGSLRTLPGTGTSAQRDGTVSAAVFSPQEYDALVDVLPVRPRLVQLVGGPVPSDLVARHFTALPGTRLRADFSPADGALPWISREFTAAGGATSWTGTLGAPLPQVQVSVVDGRGRPLADGQTGELCAAGRALPFDTVRRPGRALPAWEEAPLLRSGMSGRRLPGGELELVEPPTAT